MTQACGPTRRRWSRRWLALAACVILAPLPAYPGQPVQAPEQEGSTRQEQAAPPALAGAQEAIERKDYATAATILENFLFQNPGHVQALFNLAYCYSLQGRAVEAIDVYQQTLELDPEMVAARLNLARLWLNQDKPAKAAAELARVVELQPDNYKARFFYAGALERAGQEDAALEQYLRAAELDSNAIEPRQAALTILTRQDEWEKAEPILDQLLALAPANADLLLTRADRLLSQGQKEEALALLEKYFETRTENESTPPSTLAEIHMRAGVLARELNKGEQALQHFEAARRQGGDSFRLAGLKEQADTLAWLRRYQEAIPLYEQAFQVAPDDHDVLAGLGFAYLQTKQYTKAVPVLSRRLQLNPTLEQAYNQLASALYLAGNLPATIEVLDRRTAHAQETAGTLFLRAISHDKLQQCNPAITYYEEFLAQKPDPQSNQYFQASGRLRLLKKTCRERR